MAGGFFFNNFAAEARDSPEARRRSDFTEEVPPGGRRGVLLFPRSGLRPRDNDVVMRASLLLPLLIIIPGCSAPAPAGPASLSARLARVGLELLSEDEARLPPPERGRYVPCRVIPGFPRPPLPEHPAGYLIVGMNGGPAPDAKAILRVLAEWTPGQPLLLTVRRNPYLQAEAEWWEAEVKLR